MKKNLIKEIKYSILYRVCEDICPSFLFRIRIRTGKKFRIRIHNTVQAFTYNPVPYLVRWDCPFKALREEQAQVYKHAKSNR